MTKTKLVIKFYYDDMIIGVPNSLIFDNEKDAENYFIEKGLKKIQIEPDDNYFVFNTGITNVKGQAFWATYL